MSLEIVEVFGSLAKVGLPSYERLQFGVPPGGAFDQESLVLANLLAGVGAEEPTLELSMGQITVRATEPLVIGISGASTLCGRLPLEPGHVQTFRVEGGCRLYIASRVGSAQAAQIGPPSSLGRRVLRVIPGPLAQSFDLGRFFDVDHFVSTALDRRGVRFSGSIGEHRLEFPSEPSAVGAVQIPPNGVPIILGPDGPTVGGYPKLGFVIQADLDAVGQLQPGDTIRFQPVSLDVARELFAREMARRNRAEAAIRVALGLRP